MDSFKHNDQLAKEAVMFNVLTLLFLICFAQWETSLRLNEVRKPPAITNFLWDQEECESKHWLLNPTLKPFTGITLGSCFEKKVSSVKGQSSSTHWRWSIWTNARLRWVTSSLAVYLQAVPASWQAKSGDCRTPSGHHRQRPAETDRVFGSLPGIGGCKK